jgi:transposase
MVALQVAGESRNTQAAALLLTVYHKKLNRWQQDQIVTKVGSEEIVHDWEVHGRYVPNLNRRGRS